MRKPVIAGNWKMHKTIAEANNFANELKNIKLSPDIETVVFAPFTAIKDLAEIFKGTDIKVGAQNFHFEEEGAFTGEISAKMLKEINAEYVIIGHSERRQYFGETDKTVNLKLKKAIESALVPVVCVGESLDEREAKKEFIVIKTQIEGAFGEIAGNDAEKVIVAYEPVWAIGTGKTATSEQANEICAYIRNLLKEKYNEEIANKVRIQYGGSVKPSNVADIMGQSDIDGALVGGASLIANDFALLVNFKEK